MPASNNNWQVNGPFAETAGANVYGGGGDPVNPAAAAARLDKLRMGANRIGDAEYPDGYLGAVQSRRGGRSAAQDQLRTRLQDRAYQRGVHKDTKMSPDAYHWPVNFGPDSGLRLQAKAVPTPDGLVTQKFAPPGDPVDRYTSGMQVTDAEMTAIYQRYGINAHTGQGTDMVQPARRAILSRMAPQYSW